MDIDERNDGDESEEVALAPSRKGFREPFDKAGKKPLSIGRAMAGLQQPTTSPFLSQVLGPASGPSSGRVTVPAEFSTALPTK